MTVFGITIALGLLAFQSTSFVQCEKIHEILTNEEFFKMFRTTRDNVPEYEVAPIMHDLYKRSSPNLKMQISVFGKTFDIHLDPSDGILAGVNTPVWLASSGSNGKVNYKKLKSNIVGSVANSFVASRSLASFVIDDSSIDKPGFYGTFDELTVVPLPARVQDVAKEELIRLKREVPVSNRTLTATDYHVIIKPKASPRDEIGLEKQVDKIGQHSNGTDSHRRKRYAKNIIYPSILLVTDYSTTPMTYDESKIKDEIRYQLAFWNSVDLRFRDLESPKVRLRIAGIVIGQGRQATPYIHDSLKGAHVNFAQAIKNMPKYWNQQVSNPDFKWGAYDVIMTLTDCKLFDAKTQTAGTTGVAYSSSFCQGTTPAKFTAAGLVNDDIKFGGINTASHELGHILGASHDTDASGSCAGSAGYIMAPNKSQTIKMHDWSSCSLDKIKHFLGKANHCADQLHPVHKPGAPIRRIAPGDILTTEEQCKAHGFSYACPTEPKTCEKLRCSSVRVKGVVQKASCQDARVGALDGTLCAPGAICVRGVCRKGDKIIQ